MNERSWRNTRFSVVIPITVAYLAVCIAVRAALTVYEGNAALFTVKTLGTVFGIGLIYDLAATAWMLVPFIVNALIWSGGPIGRKGHAVTATVMAAVATGMLGFSVTGEFLFWNEFSARYNFIAVDYLVYTREVTGNITQSYPMAELLSWTGVGIVLLLAMILPFVWRWGLLPAPRRSRRVQIAGGYAALLVCVFFGINEAPHAWQRDAAEKELASNGYYALFRAFRNNDLAYDQFYATLPTGEVQTVLGDELREAGLDSSSGTQENWFTHDVKGHGMPLGKNVVLVTIESLGADYVEAFGGYKGLTPNLSALAAKSAVFTNLYATGLRTVRGLEAVTLSLPPTPGRAVPIREHNKGLMSLGSVLEDNGYDSMYIYGGYSYFDNMRSFFTGAGYDVYDRTDIDAKDIHHETIWGVADEDLFDFAIRILDRKSDAAEANRKPFFAHIMTTSNHRPYTYPDGRIDIPSHSGRDGAVKYTDYAIGKFLEDARDKPWFKDTIFVFLADHTSHGRGRTDLPPENYRIPMWIYSPDLIAPKAYDQVASQIDVGPTLLGLLNISYKSAFFGHDIINNGTGHQRAFMANYLTVGYMEDGLVVELAPQGRVRVVDAHNGKVLPIKATESRHAIEEAISFYQTASREIEHLTRP
jgi:phosphoglycerol transferase MdoB-like AlkP superfamily enzyme